MTIDGPLLLLTVVALANGIWNTAVGSTGGIMYATMAATLSPAVAIPTQSIVEGSSAAFRTWRLRAEVRLGFLAVFAAGGIIGGVAGYAAISRLLTSSSDDLFRLLVGVLILATTWLPAIRAKARRWVGPAFAGALTTFLCLFVGGMGAPISAAVESAGEEHKAVIATSTAALYLQYVLRIAVFGAAGAVLAEYLGLILVLTAASLLGTVIGARLLLQVDQEKARRLFRVVVTSVAISMILRAVA